MLLCYNAHSLNFLSLLFCCCSSTYLFDCLIHMFFLSISLLTCYFVAPMKKFSLLLLQIWLVRTPPISQGANSNVTKPSKNQLLQAAKEENSHGFYIRWLLISRCARMMCTWSFSEKKIGFDYSFDVTKCLQQIEMPDLLHVCA